MASFLLIISFLLHIIVLIAVYYLFQQIQLLKQDNTKELTDLFETYLREIRIENRRLESEIDSAAPQTEQIKNQKKNVIHIQNEDSIMNEVDSEEVTLTTDTIDDTFETSLEAKILQLHHQGIEVTEIAQMLNCGKTEAALIINLYQKRNHKS